VTGSIVALRGHADLNGLFIIQDHCYAGVPFLHDLPAQIDIKNSRGLFDEAALAPKSKRQLIMLMSGLEFGMP
jgi:hypothetical protein